MKNNFVMDEKDFVMAGVGHRTFVIVLPLQSR